MWMFRAGKRNRWQTQENQDWRPSCPDKPADVARAAVDLLPDGDGTGLSVYRVTDSAEESPVSAYYATLKERPEKQGYVLIPDSCLEGFPCSLVPYDELPPFLRGRHHEIGGLEQEAARLELSRRVLAHPEIKVVHLSEPQVRQRVRDRIAVDPDIRKVLNARWQRELGLPDAAV